MALSATRKIFLSTVFSSPQTSWSKAVVLSVNMLHHRSAQRHLFSHSDSNTTSTTATQKFDEKLLEHLVCPLSKKDLRYDREKNELVCDELGVAYPIINGIPNLVPQDARMLNEGAKNSLLLKS